MRGACRPRSLSASTCHHGLKTAPRGDVFSRLRKLAIDGAGTISRSGLCDPPVSHEKAMLRRSPRILHGLAVRRARLVRCGGDIDSLDVHEFLDAVLR